MREIIIIAHNIRSTHNIGSIFRTGDGFGVKKIILSGYSPYPLMPKDDRLPHIAAKIDKNIHKTALGAEHMIDFCHVEKPNFIEIRKAGFKIVGLEQSADSIKLPDYKPPDKIALLLGEEVEGIDKYNLQECDDIIEIPMAGKKESYNVSVATGIALYALTTI